MVGMSASYRNAAASGGSLRSTSNPATSMTMIHHNSNSNINNSNSNNNNNMNANNSNNNNPAFVSPYQHRIRKLAQPPPTSLPLTAALQLLEPTCIGQTVYLMDQTYLLNWLRWALHQIVPDSEASRLREAIRLAALQMGLPTSPHDDDDYHDPGPVDATTLSMVGHPLVLSPLVQVIRPPPTTTATTTTNLSQSLRTSSLRGKNGNNSHHHVAPIPLTSTRSLAGVSSTPNGSHQTNNNNKANKRVSYDSDWSDNHPNRRGNSANNSVVAAAAAQDDSKTTVTNSSDAATAGGEKTIYCLAVPEAFYETLQSVHGVLCDDGFSVTFQPADSERLLLQHHHHHHPVPHHHHHSETTSLSSPSVTLQQQQQQVTEPVDDARPIEFRRKVVRDLTVASVSTLMEKLMWEEVQRRDTSRMSMIEVHPIKLSYKLLQHRCAHHHSDGENNDSHDELVVVEVCDDDDASSSHRNGTSSLQGFVLISRETLALDALLALMRAAAPHKSTEFMRLWSKQIYTLARPTAQARDDYELVDLNSLDEKQTTSSSSSRGASGGSGAGVSSSHPSSSSTPVRTINGKKELSTCSVTEKKRDTVQDWVSRHWPDPKATRLDVLVETRRTVHSPWPRAGLELENRIQVGDFVDAQDVAGKWYEAIVRKVDDDTVTVHYMGWASRWDARIKRRQSHTAPIEGIPNKVKAPVPLWTRTERWRERIRVGDIVEVRDTSSLAERPKWYKGEIKKVGNPNDRVRPLDGGAELEKYDVGSPGGKKEHLLLLRRAQQVLVEVPQEKMDKSGQIRTTSPGEGDLAAGLNPQPPYLRWVNLYGEEICKLGTHLKADNDSGAPVTLNYEYEGDRKPVEVLKSHPMLGAGFMRESLRGSPPAPGSVGLHNLGNSCFLNATVQCLNHIEPLTQYFLQERFMNELNRKNPLGSGGNVAVAYASLLRKMWSGEYSVLAPRLLKQTVASFAPQFDNCYQHDSHEFCQFLMDGLHEDLNRVVSKPYVEELEGYGMDDQIAAIESWRKHLLRHDSIVVDHCQGMHRSHLTCPRCGRESIKFDVFSSISLPLAKGKSQTNIKLEDCLEKFMVGEQLDDKNAWYA